MTSRPVCIDLPGQAGNDRIGFFRRHKTNIAISAFTGLCQVIEYRGAVGRVSFPVMPGAGENGHAV